MEESCPATPLVLTRGNSKSPLLVPISSPESDGMKSPSRDSPDSHCVICLGRLQNKSFTDSCLHQFCFQCLLQWSKVKPECPLCKQPFKSIIHNVRSNLDYDQYHVEHGEPHYVLSDLVHSYNFDLIPVGRRFRYRSTMTREYFRELAESFLAHTRRLPEDSYQISPMVPVDPAPAQGVRRSSRLHANSAQQRTRQRGTSDFRRNIYAQDLWVHDLADISGRYRECTPQFYRENPAQIHRIIPWLNREVNVLLSDCESHAAYVLSRIVALLSQHPIKSREFREIIQPYFGDRTEHFIHELYTFAHSVYDIAGFDQHAVYGTNPTYATEVQEISSTSDDSDIEVLETVNRKEKNAKKSSQGFKKILLKRAGDAEKPGEPVAGPSGLSSGTSESIEICESDPEDVKVVEYVKPPPEVVTLSSGEEDCKVSDVEIANGTNSSDTDKHIDRASDEDYVLPSERKKSKYKTGKGKCKSNGVGLKGKQKEKYFKPKRRRSSSSSSSDASSTASSFRSSSSSSSRRTSISITSNTSSDQYMPSSPKKKVTNVTQSTHKKKSSSKSQSKHSPKSQSHSCGSEMKKKKVIRSYVVVPNWSSETESQGSRHSKKDSHGSRHIKKDSHGSRHSKKDSHGSRYRKKCERYRSTASSEGSRRRGDSRGRERKTKRKHRECSSEERFRKRGRDSSSSSERSTHSATRYSKTVRTNSESPERRAFGEDLPSEPPHASLASTSSNYLDIELSPRTESD